jgi:NAD(P)-dependent dehydrogenase (short-subunit alcohol dehydrogenase family)
VAITRSAASELGEFNVRVNAILPGYIRTETSSAQGGGHDPARILARPQTPEDLVGAALFLASDASAYMTGQSLNVDGGRTFH